jgi:hypothetical protein
VAIYVDPTQWGFCTSSGPCQVQAPVGPPFVWWTDICVVNVHHQDCPRYTSIDDPAPGSDCCAEPGAGGWTEAHNCFDGIGLYCSFFEGATAGEFGATPETDIWVPAGEAIFAALYPWSRCGYFNLFTGMPVFQDPCHCGGCNSFPSGYRCQATCPVCSPPYVFDNATGKCKTGVYDGHCPPGTHPDPVCGACVSDTPPKPCWFWQNCRWNPPSACTFPLRFDPANCLCFCDGRICPPQDYPDPVNCTCAPCAFDECWCEVERRCVTCDDPLCKTERGCVWNTDTCDWDCLTPACDPGQVYDLKACRCVGACDPGQCWCALTSTCMACTPPDCWRELHCVWDVDACDWACQPPPCVPPATWTGPPLCKCVGGEKGPWNFHTILAHYHAASDDKGILYERSEGPTPPFAASVQITTDPAHTQPRMVHDWRGRWLLLYTDNSSGSPKVVEIVSHDDGDTWSHPRTVFMSAKHPMPAGPLPYSGCVLYAAYDGGNLLIERSYPGDLSPSASFTAQDDAGAALVVDDASFGLSQAPDGPGRWVLHALQGGTRHHLLSTDDGESWEVVS